MRCSIWRWPRGSRFRAVRNLSSQRSNEMHLSSRLPEEGVSSHHAAQPCPSITASNESAEDSDWRRFRFLLSSAHPSLLMCVFGRLIAPAAAAAAVHKEIDHPRMNKAKWPHLEANICSETAIAGVSMCESLSIRQDWWVHRLLHEPPRQSKASQVKKEFSLKKTLFFGSLCWGY